MARHYQTHLTARRMLEVEPMAEDVFMDWLRDKFSFSCFVSRELQREQDLLVTLLILTGGWREVLSDDDDED